LVITTEGSAIAIAATAEVKGIREAAVIMMIVALD
jgi:hypothetical protein